MQSPIFITGLPRSGTSLTAGIVQACGAWGGEMVAADQYNARGYFENSKLSDFFWHADQIYSSDEHEPFLEPGKLQKTIEMFLTPQGYQGGPWFYKDPTLWDCAWEYLVREFPDAKWVIARRNISDIANSFMRYSEKLAGYDAVQDCDIRVLENGAENELKKIARFKENSGADYKEIWPFRSLDDTLAQYKALIDWLGLQWNEQAVRAFIDPSLCHHDSEGYVHDNKQPG